MHRALQRKEPILPLRERRMWLCWCAYAQNQTATPNDGSTHDWCIDKPGRSYKARSRRFTANSRSYSKPTNSRFAFASSCQFVLPVFSRNPSTQSQRRIISVTSSAAMSRHNVDSCAKLFRFLQSRFISPNCLGEIKPEPCTFAELD